MVQALEIYTKRNKWEIKTQRALSKSWQPPLTPPNLLIFLQYPIKICSFVLPFAAPFQRLQRTYFWVNLFSFFSIQLLKRNAFKWNITVWWSFWLIHIFSIFRMMRLPQAILLFRARFVRKYYFLHSLCEKYCDQRIWFQNRSAFILSQAIDDLSQVERYIKNLGQRLLLVLGRRVIWFTLIQEIIGNPIDT